MPSLEDLLGIYEVRVCLFCLSIHTKRFLVR